MVGHPAMKEKEYASVSKDTSPNEHDKPDLNTVFLRPQESESTRAVSALAKLKTLVGFGRERIEFRRVACLAPETEVEGWRRL